MTTECLNLLKKSCKWNLFPLHCVLKNANNSCKVKKLTISETISGIWFIIESVVDARLTEECHRPKGFRRFLSLIMNWRIWGINILYRNASTAGIQRVPHLNKAKRLSEVWWLKLWTETHLGKQYNFSKLLLFELLTTRTSTTQLNYPSPGLVQNGKKMSYRTLKDGGRSNVSEKTLSKSTQL